MIAIFLSEITCSDKNIDFFEIISSALHVVTLVCSPIIYEVTQTIERDYINYELIIKLLYIPWR